MPENAGNVVRFNISENDGRQASHASASGIQVGGRVNGAEIYGNTVYMDGPGSNTVFPSVFVYGASYHDPDDLLIANNLLVTADNSTLVRLVSRNHAA